MKRFLVWFGILALLFNVPAYGDGKKTFKVVIDAGHGGHDSGTRGKQVWEKDIALKLALMLGEKIGKEMPDVEVVYTRKTDVFIELHRRAQIANEQHADLFISIHCNGVKSTQPKGTETWVMGLHKSAANLEVAKTENAVILLEDDYSVQYDGFDPNSPEAYIIFSFLQNAYLDQSLEMARLVQDEFRDKAGRIDRGVKQAGFLVLYRTTMPGILVEAGFLSNATEEAYLASAEGQEEITGSIFRALKAYREQLNRQGIPGRPNGQASPSPAPNNTAASSSVASTVPAQAIQFAVQVKSSPTRVALTDPLFKGLGEIGEYEQEGTWKYYVKGARSYAEAMEMQRKLKAAGHGDAFVIAFRNGRRIPVNEARQALGQ
ncbi:MAG TPA: N-acetylmuramoyl-L-alanine amidase [Bacteroidales bacterium]|nr:N-acetylmuramoyl-L-alanine amidase [Bacteroidales bacterium]